ncbi:MAG: hypothetical protein WBL27_06490 [Salinimicrobium sp.]
MKTKLTILALGLLLMGSCKDEQKEAIATPAAEGKLTEDSIKVNPAHGLPGHTCDLPVGAPLNSATAKTNTTTPVSELPSSSVSPIRIDQRPELNPAHGEQYHDCSIPVGAKLKKG